MILSPINVKNAGADAWTIPMRMVKAIDLGLVSFSYDLSTHPFFSITKCPHCGSGSVTTEIRRVPGEMDQPIVFCSSCGETLGRKRQSGGVLTDLPNFVEESEEQLLETLGKRSIGGQIP